MDSAAVKQAEVPLVRLNDPFSAQRSTASPPSSHPGQLLEPSLGLAHSRRTGPGDEAAVRISPDSLTVYLEDFRLDRECFDIGSGSSHLGLL